MTVDLFDKEHYELLEQFEREYQLKPDAREKDKAWWKRGHIYSNGEINRDFQNYRRGYSFGKKSAEVRALPQPQPASVPDEVRDAIRRANYMRPGDGELVMRWLDAQPDA